MLTPLPAFLYGTLEMRRKKTFLPPDFVPPRRESVRPSAPHAILCLLFWDILSGFPSIKLADSAMKLDGKKLTRSFDWAGSGRLPASFHK
ncbi:MAG: hypothetical protein AMJ94_02610 [Deltaproteobacteria bacterium SM23_61]|nr:MAG: hypothetical protein AMJ94_02610 [Deltaproteobacteria bacterium SM23_61]